MASRPARILPESAYDFWARDVRDGELGPVRGSIRAARKDAREMRRRGRLGERLFFANWIEVRWVVNELKVLRLLERSRAR